MTQVVGLSFVLEETDDLNEVRLNVQDATGTNIGFLMLTSLGNLCWAPCSDYNAAKVIDAFNAWARHQWFHLIMDKREARTDDS